MEITLTATCNMSTNTVEENSSNGLKGFEKNEA